MTDRLGRMLERAAEGVRPQETDPVPAIARRVRRARRRTVAAACVAVAVLLGVGGVAAVRVSERVDGAPVTPAASPTLPPPVSTPVIPVLEGGTVRAAGFRMPVPAGWTVETENKDICETADRTIFLNAFARPGGSCPGTQTILTIYAYSMTAPNAALPHGTERLLTLPGGQPAWTSATRYAALTAGPDTPYRSVAAILPWAGIRFTVAGEREVVRAVVDSMRTEPVAADRLVLPERSDTVGLLLGRSPDSAKGARPLVDPAAVDTVYRTLATLTRPVPAGQVCPSGSATYRVELSGRTGGVAVVLVLGRDSGCDQVMSSLGGRVWLTPEARAALLPYVSDGDAR